MERVFRSARRHQLISRIKQGATHPRALEELPCPTQSRQ